MISPANHILLLLVALPLVHFFSLKVRLWILSALGAAVLLFVSAGSFWIVGVTILEGLLLERVLRNRKRNSMWRQYLPYLLLLNVFTSDLLSGPWKSQHIMTLGVAFAVVRVFMTTKQLLGTTSTLHQRIASMCSGGFFLPVIIVGPVLSGTNLWSQTNAEEADLGTTEFMYRKMFFGWILATLVSPWMAQRVSDPHLESWTAPFIMLALFGFLFTSFWGQSLIAEAGASLAGFSVPQNFNRPWMATDIRDFWNRWHTSMAKFVTQYIFIPLNLRGVKPKVATLIAFVFMGLWHEVKIGYILWGLVHGLLMAFAPKATELNSRTARVLNRVLTLSAVISISYVANYAFKI
jgi:D-alanyl-lipoteichoic acid acyltransferase DltB (MBOAT superfamily)